MEKPRIISYKPLTKKSTHIPTTTYYSPLSNVEGLGLGFGEFSNTMTKINRTDWQVILKVIIAIATTLFGVLGTKDNEKQE